MHNNSALDDLSYIKSLAEEGRQTPLLGGRIGFMWGCLLVPTLTLHGLSVSGTFGLSFEYIGLLWFAFGVIGGLLSLALGRTLKDKPGINSVNNRVEQAVWTASAIAVFTIAISIAVAVVLRGQSTILFDMIMAIAFATQAMNYFILAQISQDSALLWPSAIALFFAVVMIVFIGSSLVYFMAAIGVVITIILPALSDMRKEPKNVI